MRGKVCQHFQLLCWERKMRHLERQTAVQPTRFALRRGSVIPVRLRAGCWRPGKGGVISLWHNSTSEIQSLLPHISREHAESRRKRRRVSYCLFPCRQGWWLGSVRCAAGGLWAGWQRAACSCYSSCWEVASWSHRMTVTEWRSCKRKRYYNRNHSTWSGVHIQENTFLCLRQSWATASEITNSMGELQLNIIGEELRDLPEVLGIQGTK